VDGCDAVDICSDNSHRDGADTGHGHMMSTKTLIWALAIVALIFIANLGALWLVSTL
jgi:hypothetical protein